MKSIALVGGAHIHTPGFVNMLKKRDDVRVVSVWDPSPVVAQARAEALGAAVVAEPGAIYADRAVEAVVVTSQTDLHEELGLGAAAAGKHLFVEKPLGMAGADAYRMAAAIDKAGVRFQTGYFRRSGAIEQHVRKLVQDGAFGKVTRARMSNCHQGSLGGWFDDKPGDPANSWRWMADPKRAGCGAFGDLGTHVLDILMWVFGGVASCTASIGVATGRYGDCDEFGEGLMRFENGVVATFAAGWVDVANPVTLLVSGTKGHAAVVDGKLYLKLEGVEGADGKTPVAPEQLPKAQPHAFELFLDAVVGKPLPEIGLVSAKEAAARSAVMEAMYDGAARSAWVAPAGG